MRYSLALGLIVMLAPDVLADDKPIPQDTVRMEKRRRELLEWNRRTLQGAYDKVGKKDPKWDEKAREAFDLAARAFSKQVDPVVNPADFHGPAKAAVDAGCDDPLLIYLFDRSALGKEYPGQEESTRRMKAAAKALAASRYPVFRRANALQLAGWYLLSVEAPNDAVKAEAHADFDATLALLIESARTDERSEFWEDRWFDIVNELVRGYRTLGMNGPSAYKRVDDELAKALEMEVLRLQYCADFWYHFGWEARTNAFGPKVPVGGFETLEQCLATAKTASEAAWKLRPEGARTPGNLMEIDKAIGGDRATMDLWFDRAMKADGDMRDACWSKLDWLDPKWHGTTEEMVAFGRQCRDTKNWRAAITLLCADAHNRYAGQLDRDGMEKYLASPEVWSDITSVYEEYLKHYPDDYVARSKYASLGFASRHYSEANAQFQVLSDNLTSWREFPFYQLDTLKKFRAYCAKVVAKIDAAKKKDVKP